MLIENCTHADLLDIRRNITDFWDDDRALGAHHPLFVFEFGRSAFVIRENGVVLAYLIGFVAEDGITGYVHLIAVRRSHQKQGLGRKLYDHFTEFARSKGCRRLKAITSPGNIDSIQFHQKIGMQVSPVYKNYSGEGHDRVIFEKAI